MRTLLIDGDIWAYRACLRHEHVIHWGDDQWTLHGEFGPTQVDFDFQIETMKQQLGADKVVVALSSTENFRKKILPTYKHNRKDVRKPVTYGPLREYIKEVFPTKEVPGLEGDDVLGILLTSKKIIEGEKIVVSCDKDMATLPGLHINHDKAMDHAMNGGDYSDLLVEVTEEMADRWHMVQTIAGDATDGYDGVPGLGLKRAAALIDGGLILQAKEHTFSRGARAGETETRWETGVVTGTPWEIVLSAYASAGLGEEYALATARVARILRATDWNFTKKEPKLWTPPAP